MGRGDGLRARAAGQGRAARADRARRPRLHRRTSTGCSTAFAGFAARRLGWNVDVEQVALVTDVMVGVEELLRVLTAPGDGVIVNPPVYPPYFADIAHAGRRVVEVPLLERRRAGRRRDRRARSRRARGRCCSATRTTRPGACCTRDGAGGGRRRRRRARRVGDRRTRSTRRWRSGDEFVPWLTVSARGAALTSASKAFNLPGLKLGLIVSASSVARLPTDAALTTRATWAWSRPRRRSATATSGWTRRSRRSRANHALLPSLLPAGDRVAVPAQASFLAWLDCRAAGLGDDPAAVFLERGRVALVARAGLRRAGRGLRAAERRDDARAGRGGRQAPGGGADAVKRRDRLVDHADRAELDHQHHVARRRARGTSCCSGAREPSR